ncbi:MAG: phosphate uptake regulator PhoU [Candidatus Bathyarchaeia archaeon]
MELKRAGEIRRLQITGGSTYTVSLPKSWVEKMGLVKGSPLIIAEQEGDLLISSKEMGKPEETLIAVIEASPDEKAETLIRKTVSAYLVGYNIIEIRPKEQRLSSAQRNTLKDFSRRMLVGAEIINDAPSKLTLQILLGYPELSVKSVLRRMCTIAVSMHRDAMTALRELNHELARDIILTDDEVDRFSLYIIRQLKAAVENERIIKDIGLASPRDCLGYRLIIKSVERAADHAVQIAKNVMLLNKPVDKQVADAVCRMSSSATSLFEEAVEALFRNDFERADLVVQKTGEIAAMEKSVIESFFSMEEAETISILRLIVESIRRTAEYASDISEIVLNLTINRVIVTSTLKKQEKTLTPL